MEEEKSEPLRNVLRTFLRECMEALIAVVVMNLIAEKNTEPWRIFRIAIMVGAITTALKYYSSDTHSKVREGMIFTMGSSLIAGGG